MGIHPLLITLAVLALSCPVAQSRENSDKREPQKDLVFVGASVTAAQDHTDTAGGGVGATVGRLITSTNSDLGFYQHLFGSASLGILQPHGAGTLEAATSFAGKWKKAVACRPQVGLGALAHGFGATALPERADDPSPNRDRRPYTAGIFIGSEVKTGMFCALSDVGDYLAISGVAGVSSNIGQQPDAAAHLSAGANLTYSGKHLFLNGTYTVPVFTENSRDKVARLLSAANFGGIYVGAQAIVTDRIPAADKAAETSSNPQTFTGQLVIGGVMR